MASGSLLLLGLCTCNPFICEVLFLLLCMVYSLILRLTKVRTLLLERFSPSLLLDYTRFLPPRLDELTVLSLSFNLGMLAFGILTSLLLIIISFLMGRLRFYLLLYSQRLVYFRTLYVIKMVLECVEFLGEKFTLKRTYLIWER